MKVFLVLFSLMLCSSLSAYTVLLDPGHGGEDIGAIGQLKQGRKKQVIYEKNLTLAITKKIYKHLTKKYAVYMTRTIDRTIPLLERAGLADKMSADLFVSIHINSSQKHTAHGMELFYLDNHKDKAVEKVEQLENFSDKSQKFDPVQHILTDLVIEKTVETSKKLGKLVNQELAGIRKKYHIKDRGIKPGLFYVLLLAKRPGLLVEIGFISNPQELRRMLNLQFQEQVARAIARGISRYIKQVVGVKETFF